MTFKEAILAAIPVDGQVWLQAPYEGVRAYKITTLLKVADDNVFNREDVCVFRRTLDSPDTISIMFSFALIDKILENTKTGDMKL